MLALPSTRAVLAGVAYPREGLAVLRARAALLASTYDALIPGGCAPVVREIAPGVALVALGAPGEVLGTPILWGAAIGPDGPVGADDVRGALAAPARAAEWRGMWVVAGEHEGALRLASTPTPIHTLVHAAHGDFEVVATRGLAALVLAGRPPRIAEERIPEQVLFDFVMADQELLDGTRILPEATLAHLRPGRPPILATWRERGLRRGPAPEDPAQALIDAASAEARMAARHPAVRFGLTGGRDSTLVAQAAAGAGIRLPCFVLGTPDMPDSRGAALVACELGLDLEYVGVSPEPDGASFETLVHCAPWQEGMENARAVLVGELDWDREGVVWLSGHAGEVCRAYYWDDAAEQPDLRAVVDLITGDVDLMAPQAAAALRDRALRTLESYAPYASDPLDALDLHYTWTRLFSWSGRILPYRQIDGVVPGLFSPEAIDVMLRVPVDERRGGRAFDAALALDGRELYPRALAAATEPPARPLPKWRRGLRRLRGGPPGVGDWPLLTAARRGHEPEASLTRRVVGAQWWDRLVTQSYYDAGIQRLVWNGLGVDAMDRCAADLRQRLAALA